MTLMLLIPHQIPFVVVVVVVVVANGGPPSVPRAVAAFALGIAPAVVGAVLPAVDDAHLAVVEVDSQILFAFASSAALCAESSHPCHCRLLEPVRLALQGWPWGTGPAGLALGDPAASAGGGDGWPPAAPGNVSYGLSTPRRLQVW